MALIVVFVNLFSRLDQLSNNYNNLQSSVSYVTTNVNNQISSITGRVEEILKSQNELTASYGTELLSADLAQNTATFMVRAIPKTYIEGMSAIFVADSGSGPVEFPGELEAGREFSAEITCELTDSITLSVVFITGEQRETQVLDQYCDLYSGSFPYAWLWPLWLDVDNGVLKAGSDTQVEIDFAEKNGFCAQAADIQVGLFRDQKLLCWYKPTEKSVIVNVEQQEQTFYVRKEDIALEPGHVYCEAVVLTDEYGRQRVYPNEFIQYDGDGESSCPANPYDVSNDPKDWTY